MVGGFIATLPSWANARRDRSRWKCQQAALSPCAGHITFGFLYILISALFCMRPHDRVAWHQNRTSHVLFHGVAGNKLPFLAYGTDWAAIFFALQTAMRSGSGLSPAAARSDLLNCACCICTAAFTRRTSAFLVPTTPLRTTQSTLHPNHEVPVSSAVASGEFYDCMGAQTPDSAPGRQVLTLPQHLRRYQQTRRLHGAYQGMHRLTCDKYTPVFSPRSRHRVPPA